MRIYTPMLVAMMGATPALAGPVTWDYDATSCTLDSGGSCSGGIAGSIFSTFTEPVAIPPGSLNSYVLDTAPLPPFTSGDPNFSLTAYTFTFSDGTICNGCSLSIDYVGGAAPSDVTLSNGIADTSLTLKGTEWSFSEAPLNGFTVAGSWQEVTSPSPVNEPGSSFLWLLCGLFTTSMLMLFRKRV